MVADASRVRVATSCEANGLRSSRNGVADILVEQDEDPETGRTVMDRQSTPEEQFAAALDDRRASADPSVAPLLEVVRVLRLLRARPRSEAKPRELRRSRRARRADS